jgi:branched-chain amino acid transport system permease protein
MLVLQLLASGIQTGVLYGLTAAGFALIFGATRIFHVAHGASFMLAGYAFLEAINLGAPWPVAVAVAALIAIGFGLTVDYLVYRPIQRHEASFFTVFVASFGVVICVQSLVQIFFGRGSIAISSPLTRATEIFPGFYLAPVFWVSIGVAIVLFPLIHLFLERTNAGIGLRALSENPELLRSYGLSSRRLSALAFAIGSALVVPGAILSVATTGIEPAIASRVMLISISASVVGGVGSLRGAALAGLGLGVIENLVVLVLDTQWSEAASFVVLFAFIVLRPSGLFGRPIPQ